MRLMRITINYYEYLRQFYVKHPNSQDRPYQEQYASLMDDCYGWANFWTVPLGKLGYDVWEPVGNAEPQQKAWAREHGIAFNEATWLTDITAAQIRYFQPEILLMNDYITYLAEFFRNIREQCPSIRLIIGWCGAPYENSDVFNAYDLVLSNIPSLVEHFRERGLQSEYLCHAFEPGILQKLPQQLQPSISFSFLGSIVKQPGFHNQREQLLKTLVQETDLQIWSALPPLPVYEMRVVARQQALYDWIQAIKWIPGSTKLLATFPKFQKYAHMENRPMFIHSIDESLRARTHPPVFGIEMYQKLRESQVTLNTHIDISSQFASNMRLYEATGVGACLLTEWQPNLHEVFEPDVEVVTYRNEEEAVEKVRYLLQHERECHNIGIAGQRRTLRCHTFELRAQQLDAIIRHYL